MLWQLGTTAIIHHSSPPQSSFPFPVEIKFRIKLPQCPDCFFLNYKNAAKWSLLVNCRLTRQPLKGFSTVRHRFQWKRRRNRNNNISIPIWIKLYMLTRLSKHPVAVRVSSLRLGRQFVTVRACLVGLVVDCQLIHHLQRHLYFQVTVGRK